MVRRDEGSSGLASDMLGVLCMGKGLARQEESKSLKFGTYLYLLANTQHTPRTALFPFLLMHAGNQRWQPTRLRKSKNVRETNTQHGEFLSRAMPACLYAAPVSFLTNTRLAKQ